MKDMTPICKPEDLFEMDDKEIFIRLYTYQKVLDQLETNKNEGRRREQMRVKIAQGLIKGWRELAEEAYNDIDKD